MTFLNGLSQGMGLRSHIGLSQRVSPSPLIQVQMEERDRKQPLLTLRSLPGTVLGASHTHSFHQQVTQGGTCCY